MNFFVQTENNQNGRSYLSNIKDSVGRKVNEIINSQLPEKSSIVQHDICNIHSMLHNLNETPESQRIDILNEICNIISYYIAQESIGFKEMIYTLKLSIVMVEPKYVSSY